MSRRTPNCPRKPGYLFPAPSEYVVLDGHFNADVVDIEPGQGGAFLHVGERAAGHRCLAYN